MTHPPITHALFDLDGLLLDTESIYTTVTQKIVSRFNKTFTWAQKRNMIGRPALESARYLVKSLNLPLTPEAYLTERDQMLKAAFPDAQPLPGAEKLIRHLHHHQIPIALATSSSREMLQIKIARHPWFNLFTTLVTGDDPALNGRGKPDPAIFLLAAKRINAPAPSTLIFEDAPAGLQAGIAAKMRVIIIAHSAIDPTHYTGADLTLPSLTHFPPETYGLPPY